MPNASRAHKLRHGLAVIAFAFSLPALADAGKAAAFYEDGLARFEKGDTAGAVIQLKNALQQNNKLLSAHVLLGRALLKQTELPAAEAAFSEALKLGVSPSEIAAPRAQLLMALGRTKDLLKEIHPDRLSGDALVEVLTLRARALGLEGNVDAARQGFKVAVDTDPLSVRPYQALVPFLIQQGELAEADAQVNKLIQIAPKQADTWNLRASLHHVRGRLSAALADYDQALLLDPSLVDARVARASLLVDLKRNDQAQRDLDYLAEHAKKEPRSAYLRALVAGRRGDDATALGALREVASLVDSLPVEYVNANEQLLMLGALAHHGLNGREKAKEYLDALLRRYSRNIGARKLLAGIYLDEGDNARALTTVEPVLRLAPNDPQANLLAGRAHLGYKRYRQAGEYLERAVQNLAQNPSALAALGVSLLGQGDAEAGIASLEKAAAAGTGDTAIGMVLASLYMQRGEQDKALALVERIVRNAPDDLVAINLLGAVKNSRGDVAGAQAAYEKVLARDPDFIPAMLNLARLHVARNQIPVAREQLLALLKRHPNDARAMYEMGTLEQRAGQLEKAVDWLRKAVLKQPDQPLAALALVEALSRAGKHGEALSAAKEIGLRHPDSLSVQAVLGRAYLGAGDAKGARQVFRNMTRIAEFDADAQVRIGRLMLGAGFPDDAEYNLQKANTVRQDYPPTLELEIDLALARSDISAARDALERLRKQAPDYADLPRYGGAVALAAGNGPEALKLFQQMYRQAPTARAALNLSAVQQQIGDIKAAEASLQAELQRTPSTSVREALAHLQIKSGQWQAAKVSYQQLLEETPSDANLLNNLSLVLLQLKDPAALETAEAARALAPRSPGVIDTVGWIRLQAGDVEGALALLRDARLRAPDDREIRYHLAVALAKSGRKGEAKAELEAAMAGGAEFAGADAARSLLHELAR